MAKEYSNSKMDYFFITMTDLLRACFSDSENHYFKGPQAIDFFLYMIKYDKASAISSYGNELNRNTLQKTLAANKGRVASPSTAILFDFLQEYLLNPKQNITRSETYSDETGKIFMQKSLPDLIDYCRHNLSPNLQYSNNTTIDSIIDFITICLLTGRHGIPSYKAPLSNLYRPNSDSKLLSLLNARPSRFTIIHGSLYDRASNYMEKYVLNQIQDISYKSSFSSYQNNDFSNIQSSGALEKYINSKQDFYYAMLNAYLMQKENHYFAIYSIKSSADLNTLMENCPLFKNIILICDFDIDFPQDKENISYFSFRSFYVPPCLEDIKHFFEKNSISYTSEYCQILLEITKGNLFLLYSMELLIKHLPDPTSRENLFRSLKNFSLENNENTLPTNKYSMPILNEDKRTGSTFIGHIRKLYQEILSIDEWLLLLLIALYGERGITQEELDTLLPKSFHNLIFSLINKQLISKEKCIYIYGSSLLIPYALMYGKHNLENNPKALFSDIFSFLNLLLNNICYYNSAPINYALLSVTIKKTHRSLFKLLYKTNDPYYEHFPEIWYYHIRCIKFFLENGDINSIKELDKNFSELAKKLTGRPGHVYKAWKKTYDLYCNFLKTIVSSITASANLYESIIKIIEKIQSLLKKYNFAENESYHSNLWKLLVSMLEINISLLLRINIWGSHSFYESQCATYTKQFKENIQQLKAISLQIFELHAISKDKLFISEMETIFKCIISIADLYCPPDNKITLYFPQDSNFGDQPRYKQLSWFKKSCILLGVQASSKSIMIDTIDTLTGTYQKLGIIPLEILENYYWALISYTLISSPSDGKVLLNYIYKDLERYEHIWQHSEIMLHIKNALSVWFSNI